MAEETSVQQVGDGSKRRRVGNKKGYKEKQKPKSFRRPEGKGKKVDARMKKLYKKRARDYNSSSEDDAEDDENPKSVDTVTTDYNSESRNYSRGFRRNFNEEENIDDLYKGEEDAISDEENEDADDEIQPGITKFTEGCRAFKIAFKNIVKKKVSDDSLGPVLSGHKELVAQKLAEDDAERKVKGEASKEKHLLAEKGHAKPANFLDTHDKFLIGVGTKGVVKLFNAVNKAQNAQKGLDPSRFKDAKALKKQRKDAFFSELRKTDNNSSKVASGDGEEPAWAPLRDNYMLTNSKLKSWDKMQGNDVSGDVGGMKQDSSSDED